MRRFPSTNRADEHCRRRFIAGIENTQFQKKPQGTARGLQRYEEKQPLSTSLRVKHQRVTIISRASFSQRAALTRSWPAIPAMISGIVR
jgi:hypothetical protein